MDTLSNSKKRIEWIDAMRGFTMIMVVAMHVSVNGFQESFRSPALSFLVLFRMPLFFFISGFLAYKANADWSFSGFSRMMGKKIRIQIIPTVVFFFCFIAIIYPGTFTTTIVEKYHSETKGGYWFTLVLLYMFIIYYIFEYFEQKIKRQTCIPIVLLWIAAILLYETCYLPKEFYWAYGAKKSLQVGWLYDTSIIQFFRYFHFFIFGNIIHRYWNRIEKIYDRNGFIFAIIIITFLSTGDYLRFHLLRGPWANISQTVARYSLLTLIFLFFRYYQSCFSKERMLGRFLQYTGTRTLDIYLLHFFFVPTIPAIGTFLNANKNIFIVDITLSLLGGLLVLMFCFLVSSTLRMSPFLKRYLFGR
ncbi:MAG: acyltransferase [Prevotella sp.]|nr:acyltransferase [Prevotella sp.]